MVGVLERRGITPSLESSTSTRHPTLQGTRNHIPGPSQPSAKDLAAKVLEYNVENHIEPKVAEEGSAGVPGTNTMENCL